jgi:DNA-binding transcriptional LysR family regulator
MVFVCRDDHPLARRARLGLGDLATEDLVGFPAEFGLRRLMDDAFRAAGVEQQLRYEVPAGFTAIGELVANGLGTAFMPRSEAGRFGELSSVELAEPVMWQVYLASPPADRMTPATTRLAETLLGAAARSRAG